MATAIFHASKKEWSDGSVIFLGFESRCCFVTGLYKVLVKVQLQHPQIFINFFTFFKFFPHEKNIYFRQFQIAESDTQMKTHFILRNAAVEPLEPDLELNDMYMYMRLPEPRDAMLAVSLLTIIFLDNNR